MINITSVNPTGFFCYGVHPTVNLEDRGIVLLDGKNMDKGGSNGAGKTSLFYAIASILYGDNPAGECADSATNRVLGRRFGILTFTTPDQSRWRIINPRKWRRTDGYPDERMLAEPSAVLKAGNTYTGSDLFLERWDGSIWVDERGTNAAGKMKLTMDATRSKIVSILGCSYEQFIDSCYMVQQQGLRLLTAKHKEKYEILARLSKVHKWSERRNMVDEAAAALEQEIKQLETDLAIMKAGVADPDDLLGKIQAQDVEIASLKAEQALIGDKLSHTDAEISVVEARMAQSWSVREQSLKDAQSASTRVEQLNIELASIVKANLKSRDDIIRTETPSEIEELRNKISSVSMSISIFNHELNNLVAGPGTCSKCKSYVTIEHLERQRDIIKLSILEQDNILRDLREEESKRVRDFQMAVDARLAKFDSESEAVERDLREQIAAATIARQSVLKTAEQVLAGWRLDSDTVSRLKQQKATLEGLVSELDVKIYHCIEDKRRLEAAYLSSLASASAIVKSEAMLEKRQLRLKLLSTVSRLFGDRGMQAYVLEQTVARLNSFIAKKLKAIDPRVKLWFTCFKEKSDGNLGVDIQVYVKDGDKDEVPFNLYSGGERQILTLVVLDAYSELAANMGIGFNILLLDEVFGPLDAVNSARVFEYIRSMAITSRPSVFITAHSSDIKDSVEFDSIITAVKSNNITTLSESNG